MSPRPRLFKALVLVGVTISASLPVISLADTVKIGGTGTALVPMQILANAFQKSHPDINIVIVPGLGSRGGRKAALEGAVDIGVSAEPATDTELKQWAVAIEYAKTPFVFATSKKNPVSGLTLNEIVEIYNGKITTWRDGKRLRLILRPEGDSDNRVLRSISPAMEQAVKNALSRQGMTIAVTDQEIADAIENIPGAFGTSTLALIVSEKRPLKPLSINGVAPSPKTIADGSYPYFKSLYMITRDKPSEITQQFIDFVRSRSGRETLARLGHWVVDAEHRH